MVVLSWSARIASVSQPVSITGRFGMTVMAKITQQRPSIPA